VCFQRSKSYLLESFYRHSLSKTNESVFKLYPGLTIKEKLSNSFLFSDPGVGPGKVNSEDYATPDYDEREANILRSEVLKFQPFCLSPSIMAKSPPSRRDSGLIEV